MNVTREMIAAAHDVTMRHKIVLGHELLTQIYLAMAAKRKPLITEAMIDEFLEDYEMIGETEDGRDACYTPNENDKALIKDAVMGLLAFADEAAHGIKE